MLRNLRLNRLSALLSPAVVFALACQDQSKVDEADPAGGDGAQDGAQDGGAGEGGDTGDCPSDAEWNGTECVAIDECAEDNGGCGDPALWACTDAIGGPPTCRFVCEADYAALTDGVRSVELGGSLPSALVLTGEATCPVVIGDDQRIVVGSGRYGAGRFVEFGHEGMLGGSAGGDGARLAENAAAWAAGEGRRAGVEPGTSGATRARLEAAGFTIVEVGGGDGIADALVELDLYVGTTYGERSEAEISALLAFVDAGGGVLMGGHAWWWAYSSGEDPAVGYPGNALLGPMGLIISGETTDGGTDAVPAETPSDLLHHKRALASLLSHLSGAAPLSLAEQVLGASTVGFAITTLPLSLSAYFDPARGFLDALPAPVIPTEAAPIRPAAQPVEALVLRLESKLATEGSPTEAVVAGSAADFPGQAPSGTPTETLRMTLSPSYAGYPSSYAFSGAGAPLLVSTGGWAPAGGLVRARVPAAWAEAGLSLRVGGWTDTLWGLEDWWRNPEISRVDAIVGETTELVSGFGGLVYLQVPAGVSLPEGELVVEGVIAAPRYVLGETTAPEWAERRAAPAPWAELEGEHVVLMVPADAVRGLEDPSALLGFWDEVLAAEAELAAMPLPRPRKERIQLDRQISAGWMHSGYPIMAYTAVSAELTVLEDLQRVGSWGAFHELGHNHQHRSAELDGTTEATVNLWSVYAMENVVGITRAEGHPALAPADRAARIDAYIDGGRNYAADWSVWTALETYLQVQERFGWAPFQRLFARYRAEGSAPANEQARLDRWAQWSSEEVGMDLTPFYLAWGWPLSPSVADGLSALPDWTDHPLAGR